MKEAAIDEFVEEAEVKPKKAKSIRGITKANALSMVARRRALGRMGGRPKGALSRSTILRIQSGETFQKELLKHVGQVGNDLLINSKLGDTKASDIILDRTIGPVRKDFHLTGEFSLKALHLTALPPVAGQVEQPNASAANITAAAIVPLLEE